VLYTLQKLARDRLFLMKLTLSIASMWLAGALTGLYFTKGLLALPRAHVDSHIFLAASTASAAAPQSMGSSDAVLAVQSEKLIQQAGENQASRDDRRLLHDELAKAHDLETDHFNKLNDRLNVDEAKVFTTLWLIGVIFGVLQIIPTMLAIADWRSKKMKDAEK
jgi:hypothetical protein